MSEDYLDKLKELERRVGYRTARKVYKEIGNSNIQNVAELAKGFISRSDSNSPQEEITHAQASAYKLINTKNPSLVLLGAQLYEKLGKGKKVIPKLYKALERGVIAGEINQQSSLFMESKEFIERNSGKRQQKGGLEGKTMIFLGSILGGIALNIYSLTATGNSIGNLTGTTQGLLGLILFVVGIAGLVFSRK